MGLPKWPTQAEYAKQITTSESTQPFTKKPVAQVAILWCTPEEYPGGRLWRVESLCLDSDERIFHRKIWNDRNVYWSQDTSTHLTRDATVSSAGLKDGNRVFVTNPGHSTTLDENETDRSGSYD